MDIRIRSSKTGFLMVMLKNLLLLFILMVNLSPHTQAQENPFFERDSIAYYDYVIDIFKELPKEHKDLVKTFEEEFTDFWYGGEIDDQQRDTVYGFTNKMMAQRFLVYPTFYQYLKTLEVLVANQTMFSEWHQGVATLFLEEDYDDVLRYISTSYQFLNNSILYSKSSINWAIEADTFSFTTRPAPRLSFQNATLSGYSATDTMYIRNTEGVFDILDLKWSGNGGEVSWKRAGYEQEKITTHLEDYRADMTKSYYEADSVNFYDRRIFDHPIRGDFRDGYVYVFDSSDIRYPIFTTDKFYSLDSLIEGVVLNGFLSYIGDKVLIESKYRTRASADMIRNNDRYMSIYGDVFFVKHDRFFSQNTSVSIYIGENDSIFHPSVHFEYNPQQDELLLKPRGKQNHIIPYSNSYHQMDMYCRMVQWDIQDSVLRFSEISSMDQRGSAIFESYDYYSKQRFYDIQLFDNQNPLVLLYRFLAKNNQMEFHVSQFAAYSQFTDAEADLLMIRLAGEGFVIYDRKNKIVDVKDKLLNYVKSWYGLRDYDVLRFVSKVQGTSNAELNLKNFDMEIRGIPVVYLSDSQRVFIYPKNNRIVMKKGRDFMFSGRLIAGNIELFGQNGYFTYDDFSVELPTIDSMRMNLSTGKYTSNGQPYLRKVNTVLENLEGQLEIDKPDNKSGLKPSPAYPILHSTGKSSAFYDVYSRFVGVYDRERFEYHVEPFTIDSVDNFNPTTIAFDGYLESSIFPDIHEPLKIQEDYSLGFKTTTPQEGLILYEDKGQYFDSLNLSNYGLKGKGQINYLAASANAEDVLFFPDSVTGSIAEFHLQKQTHPTQYPKVKVDSAKMRWLQTSDSMIVYEPSKPFAMYENQVELNGLIALTPDALKGKGSAKYDLATIASTEFSFRNTDFNALDGDVKLYTADGASVAAQLEDYDANVDVARRYGDFISDKAQSKIMFPYNEFISYLNEIAWDVEKQKLKMNVSDINDLGYLDTLDYREIVDKELTGAKFISTNKKQDSLQFFALKASYDMKLRLIEAEKVKYIHVADAAIFPHNEKLRIGHNAAIETLTEAKILASIENKAHFLQNATVDLISRHDFKGSGDYQFTGFEDEVFDVYFSDLYVKDNQTIGKTVIKPEDEFWLSPAFDYYGPVEMKGSERLLSYNGYFKLNQSNCNEEPPSWVKFYDKVDPDSIQIYVDHPIKDTSDVAPLYASLQFSNTNREVYPLFYESEKVENDYPLWQIDGDVSYLQGDDKYHIYESESHLPDSLKPYFEYSPETCTYEGLASLDFGYLFGRMDIEPHGVFSYSNSAAFEMESVLGADFLFAKNALKVMADTINAQDLKRVSPSGKTFEMAAAQLLNKAELKEVLDEINLYGLIRNIPASMAQTLFFTDVSLKWNNQLHSFIASGELGLGNLGNNSIGRYVNGVIEIQPTPDGGNLNIYLEPAEGVWYYFTYSGSLMEAVSSDMVFNENIDDVKRSKRYIPAKEGRRKYEYDLSGINLKEFFLRRVKNAGIRY